MLTEAEPVRRGRGRPRDPGTDTRIIAAAAALLLERGFDRTTVDEVAARAGVGKATVYRRWESKDDLAVAAMQSLFDAEIPEPDTGSIRGDLLEGYRSVIAFVGSPQGSAFVRMTVVESLRDERVAALYRSSVVRREEQAKESFRRAIARGEVRPDVDLDIVVQWLGGVIASRVITGRPLPTLDDVPALVDFTLSGVLV